MSNFVVLKIDNLGRRINLDNVDFYMLKNHGDHFSILISYQGYTGITELDFDNEAERNNFLNLLDQAGKVKIL